MPARTTSGGDVPDDRDDRDWIFDNHPDLVDPKWEKKAAKVARREARKKRRRPEQDRPADWYPARSSTAPKMRGKSFVVAFAVLLGSLLIARHPWTSNQSSTFGPVTSTTKQAAPLDLNHPFANTPAAAWGNGTDAIVLPVATPIGRYSAQQVAADLAKVKQVLVVAHLDARTLLSHDTSVYVSMFSPFQQPSMRQTFADPRHRDNGAAITLLADGFRLLPVPVKVNGTMAAAVNQNGNVVIHTNYVFVYPFAPANPGIITQPWEIDAVVHIAEDFEVADGSNYPAAGQGLYEGKSQAYFSAMGCQQSKQGYLAPAYSELNNSGTPDTQSPDAYYDLNHGFNVSQC